MVVKSGASFLLGLVVGVSAGVLIKRILVIVEEEQPDRLVDKINASLEELEQRANELESRISPQS
ncbi:MAG: hypothetical protein BGO01_08285 [Armatimonadetes bacterium 55-13]|nr:hypothetical protein [Armatimonadota bacterium]OJU62470.1 MAG: hypothetical protein BGO01_08285 [Armatimonadetes bacterium 55-13]